MGVFLVSKHQKQIKSINHDPGNGKQILQFLLSDIVNIERVGDKLCRVKIIQKLIFKIGSSLSYF